MEINLTHTACTIALFLVASIANAALIDRGGGLIYDTDRNITWLQDANYAKSSGYDVDGRLNLADAKAWAAQLEYGGHSNWRLPNTVGNSEYNSGCTPDTGYNCTASELGHMYYLELGNYGVVAPDGITASPIFGVVNTGPFTNIQSSDYWSGTVISIDPQGQGWYFDYSEGQQGYWVHTGEFFAWAVHSGDIGAVPVPAAAWLFGSGLLGLIGMARRKHGAL